MGCEMRSDPVLGISVQSGCAPAETEACSPFPKMPEQLVPSQPPGYHEACRVGRVEEALVSIRRFGEFRRPAVGPLSYSPTICTSARGATPAALAAFATLWWLILS